MGTTPVMSLNMAANRLIMALLRSTLLCWVCQSLRVRVRLARLNKGRYPYGLFIFWPELSKLWSDVSTKQNEAEVDCVPILATGNAWNLVSMQYLFTVRNTYHEDRQ